MFHRPRPAARLIDIAGPLGGPLGITERIAYDVVDDLTVAAYAVKGAGWSP